jgi:hypothetical protein
MTHFQFFICLSRIAQVKHGAAVRRRRLVTAGNREASRFAQQTRRRRLDDVMSFRRSRTKFGALDPNFVL